MSAPLCWQCEQCKASFFSQHLLLTHKSFFHKGPQDTKSAPEGKETRFAEIIKEDVATDAIEEVDHYDEHEDTNEEHRMMANLKEEQVDTSVGCVQETGDGEPQSNINSILNNLKEEDIYFLVVNDAGEAYLTTVAPYENADNSAGYDPQDTEAEMETGDLDDICPSEAEESDCEENDDATTDDEQYIVKQPSKVSIEDFIKEKPIVRKVRGAMSFPCGKFSCDKVFPTRHDRRMHLPTHAAEFHYFCKVCERGFKKSIGLRLHMETHDTERAVPCPHPQCGRVYRSQKYLKKHMRTHNPDEYKHQCQECGKKFVYPEWLRMHLNTHTTTAPYVCTLCGKAYRQAVGLKTHMLVHQGLKPFPCTVCGFSFRQKSSLKDHMRIHTGERPYTCTHEDCGRSFFSSANLRKHRKTHHGTRTYRCGVDGCKKAFFWNSHLKRHTGKIHGERRDSVAADDDASQESLKKNSGESDSGTSEGSADR